MSKKILMDKMFNGKRGRLVIVREQLIQIFGENFEELYIDYGGNLKIILFEEDDCYYYSIVEPWKTGKEFGFGGILDKNGEPKLYYADVDDGLLEKLKMKFDEHMRLANLMQPVLNHPKHRLKLLYI